MAEVRHTETRADQPTKTALSVPELVSDLGRQVSNLVSKEAGLLRAEVDEKFSNLQTAGGSLAAAAICLLASLLILLQALIVALTNMGLGAGWSSLLVGLVVGAIGVVLLMYGRSAMSDGLMPKRTQRQVQRDAEMLKEQVK
jgi:hypothetical protein